MKLKITELRNSYATLLLVPAFQHVEGNTIEASQRTTSDGLSKMFTASEVVSSTRSCYSPSAFPAYFEVTFPRLSR